MTMKNTKLAEAVAQFPVGTEVNYEGHESDGTESAGTVISYVLNLFGRPLVRFETKTGNVLSAYTSELTIVHPERKQLAAEADAILTTNGKQAGELFSELARLQRNWDEGIEMEHYFDYGEFSGAACERGRQKDQTEIIARYGLTPAQAEALLIERTDYKTMHFSGWIR